MKKKLIITGVVIVLMAIAGGAFGIWYSINNKKYEKRVNEYYQDGYIFIPTAERFIDCFVYDEPIPGYGRKQAGVEEPTGKQFERDIITKKGGIKGYKLTADLDFTNINNLFNINDQYVYQKYKGDLIEDKEGNYGGFSYNLDGNGYALKNITMEGDFASVFGTVRNGVTISNLTIEDSTFTGDRYVGAFVSYIDINNTYGKIINCKVKNCTIGSMNTEYVGGFAGYVVNTRVGDSDNKKDGFVFSDIHVINSTVKGKIHVGGVIGSYHATTDSWANTTVSKLYNTSTNVNGYTILGDDACVGGIFGSVTTLNTTATVEECGVESANIMANIGGVGGIIGNVYYKPVSILTVPVDNKIYINNCYNKGSVNGLKNVGGIVGHVGKNYEDIKFTNCNNLGSVTSRTTHAGGICGLVSTATLFTGHTAKFENCTNGFQDGSYDIDIAISGLQYVGGICGQNGTFNNCNNTMSILYGNENSNEDYSYIGGIVGETQYEIKNCSNSGWINFLVPAQATSDSNFASIIGGIVGATDAKIEGCTNSGCITGNKAVGGILGYTTASVLYFSNNSNSGTIIGYGSGANYDANNCEGNTYVGLGGLIGIIYSHQSQVIKDCSNTGNISLGNNFYGVGGFIGLVLKTINDPVVDEYSILNATINYTLYKNSNTSVYGSLIGACGTKNNDDINLDAENSLIENINNSYNQNFVVE